MITDKAEQIERAHHLAALKVPFMHQGKTLDGIDCVGGLCYILDYSEEVKPYPRDPVNGEMEVELERIFGPPVLEVSRAAPLRDQELLQACDIVSMQYAGPIRHVGFIVPHLTLPGVLSIVHTDNAVKRTTEHILDAKWLRRIVKVWRL